MKTIDEFRYTLTFRNLAGGSRSFHDLHAQRALLVEKAERISEVMGFAAKVEWDHAYDHMAQALEHEKEWIVGLIEADIMAIDAYLEKRGQQE